MYDWLTEALADSSSLVTANRRLARVLVHEYNAAQMAAGHAAWQSPSTYAWQDWLEALLSSASNQESVPTKISTHHSQWLWDRCLRREVGGDISGIANLVRLSRDTWQRLADWQITIADVARSAQSPDHRMFASAAGRYSAILKREHWIDDAGLGALVLDLICDGRVTLPNRITFAGFDRQRPFTVALRQALIDHGADVRESPQSELSTAGSLLAFDNPDAEMRGAGKWAREKIDENPDCRIAIIAQGLEQDADRVARLFREGFSPGWQYGPRALVAAANVSYGRPLSDYPAIAIALLLLRWHVRDLGALEIGLLLRSPLLGNAELAARSRLELRLRQLPDREWSPAMITSALRVKSTAGSPDEQGDGSDFLSRIATLSKLRRETPGKSSPAEWATFIDSALRTFDWPGLASQSSADFQLLNRWRELLNEFARLDLVVPQLTLSAALARLELMAGNTVFQVESADAVVHLMGPLEAAGAEFDAIWVSGLTAANWPPASSASALVSRRLQQKHDMPDASPADTVRYAELVLTRLTRSAHETVCSYPRTDDDTEQSATELIANMELTRESPIDDPGWHASRLIGNSHIVELPDDAPPVTPGESVSGGAGTIQRQMSDPISAFVFGRLGARPIYPQSIGIPAVLRGNLIHDALYNLYVDKPTSVSLLNWQNEELQHRVGTAVNLAFVRHERSADKVLQQLLRLERRRVERLLQQFVEVDRERCDFEIAGVEGELEFVSGALRLPLRYDRIDRFEDSSVVILDYKTGSRKKLMRSPDEAKEIQLFVYAEAVAEPVSGLALVNIDSREIVFDGAGRHFTDEGAWPDLLERTRDQIYRACREFEAGDVRVNIEQGTKSARTLNALSRYTELRRGD